MTQSQPPITRTTHTLPFDRLSPRDFERLCLWLVEREGYERAEHLGAAGSEQGRDIVAWRESALWAFQCKRVQRFGPQDALAEVEKVLALPEAERPAGLVFLVTCDVSANTREKTRKRCKQAGLECHFWAGTELDEKVKRHPDIVEEFFQEAISPAPTLYLVPKPPEPYIPHPFPLQRNFVGRIQEKSLLSKWLKSDTQPLAIVVAIGGMGKTSLVWTWLHENVLAKDNRPPAILWWSFYRESETRFNRFVDEALVYLSYGDVEPDSLGSAYDKTRKLATLIQSTECLVVLDGFERELRAYAGVSKPYKETIDDQLTEQARACTDFNAARFLRWVLGQNAKGHVLLTSRLVPKESEGDDQQVLPGALLINLPKLEPDQAIRFLKEQGIHGLDYEIEEAASICHHQPLNLRLLSGFILCDPGNPGDVAILNDFEWNPNVAQAERQREILDLIFNSLSESFRDVAVNLAVSRIPFNYKAINDVCTDIGLDKATVREAVQQLLDRNLLLREQGSSGYEFHPVVREYLCLKNRDRTIAHRIWSNIYLSRLKRLFQEPDVIKIQVKLDEETVAIRDELLSGKEAALASGLNSTLTIA